jgi:Phage Mu protein F like protein
MIELIKKPCKRSTCRAGIREKVIISGNKSKILTYSFQFFINMNADRLWRQYNTFRKRKTLQFAPSVYKALQAQIKYYTETKDLVNLPQEPMLNALRELYGVTGRQWATFTFFNVLKDAGVKYQEPALRIKRLGSIGLNEEFVNAILEYFQTDLFNTVTNITETTRTFIREQVASGIEQQLSLDDIINNLLVSGITKNRAALISRTETMKAANAAEQVGTDKTGLETRKEWLAVRDNRTRHDHVNVDGSIVPDGSPFNVGGYLMQRPGATKTTDGRSVPGKEICNCRCTIGRKVLRGEDGLPLRKFG